MTLQSTYCNVLAAVADNYNLLLIQKQSENWVISLNVWKMMSFKSEVKIFIHQQEVEWEMHLDEWQRYIYTSSYWFN